jgi:hypothetical protein
MRFFVVVRIERDRRFDENIIYPDAPTLTIVLYNDASNKKLGFQPPYPLPKTQCVLPSKPSEV